MRNLVLAIAALGAVACMGLPKAPAPTNPARFLSINDVYQADTLADGNGGLARLATLKQRISAEGPVLFVLAGDFLGPSLLSRYYNGDTDGAGTQRLGDRLRHLRESRVRPREGHAARAHRRSRTSSGSPPTACSRTEPACPGVVPWDTVRVFGKKIGIFGLTLQGPYPDYVRCGSPDSAAVVALDSLAAMHADIIVAITHQSLAADVALLNREGQLDLILGGHEHEAHTVAVGSRYVLKADANAVSAQFMTIWGTKGEWREAPRLLDVKPNLARRHRRAGRGGSLAGQPAREAGCELCRRHRAAADRCARRPTAPAGNGAGRPRGGCHPARHRVRDRRDQRRRHAAQRDHPARARSGSTPSSRSSSSPTRRGSSPSRSRGNGCARCSRTACRSGTSGVAASCRCRASGSSSIATARRAPVSPDQSPPPSETRCIRISCTGSACRPISRAAAATDTRSRRRLKPAPPRPRDRGSPTWSWPISASASADELPRRPGPASSSGNRAPSKQLCPFPRTGSGAGTTIPSEGGVGVPS